MSDPKTQSPASSSASAQESSDPSVFLFLWLGVPAIAMIAYAWYLLSTR